MTSKIGLAVFGMGKMGLEHVRNILRSPHAALRWIVRENVEQARALTSSYNLDTRCETPANAQKAIEDPNVEAVLIVSPSSTHEDLITRSLNAGKAVFCEKPLTTSIQSTRACYDLAEQKNKPLFCAFHRRFDPSHFSIYQQIRTGSTGPVRIVKSTSRDFSHPPIEYVKTSGGIFRDSTIHDLDMGGWIIGSRPTSVFAHGHAHKEELKAASDNDQVVVIVTYENGAISVIVNGRWCPFGYDQRLEVLCEKMQLSVENRGANHVVSGTNQGMLQSAPEANFMRRYPEAYANELEHFLDVLEGKDELRVTRRDTIQAMRLADMCYESLRTKTAVPYTD
ncbi:inositol 2-dehydrogenase-like [Mya arenaria]|uniref:inositol 2-dehydrogenase-like n=1 Tax=Mya arenaria TaxID=6604 RepID=UPI0022E97559|nr:inositol 2-dehydrogenase-like [Mya arenaria]